MLSYIDNKLIALAQWCVRQVELHTTKTRKRMLEFVLFLFKAHIVLAGGIIFLSFAPTDLFGAVTAMVLFVLLYWIIYEDQTVGAKEQDIPGTLPPAIVKRVLIRKCVLGCILIWYILCTIFAVLQGKMPGLGAGFLLILAGFPLVIEYLLCTSSLPPGEKERHKKEREMKIAAPNAA